MPGKPFENQLISSRRNPLVKRLRSFTSKVGREQESRLLLEGTHLLEEALRTSFVPLEVFATGFWIENHVEILQSVSSKTFVQEVSQAVLEAALTTKNPDGVASLFPLNGLPKPPKNANFILAMDRLQDPGNLGTLFRTAMAAEIDLVWLALGADPLSQKSLRSSAGAILHLPYERLGKSEDFAIDELSKKLQSARTNDFQVVAAVISDPSSLKIIRPYWEIDWMKPTVLVLGNEGAGIHPLLESCCTHKITLPHSNSVQSLNVASAAVPLLLERRRVTMTSETHFQR